jgi:hypothetical protein
LPNFFSRVVLFPYVVADFEGFLFFGKPNSSCRCDPELDGVCDNGGGVDSVEAEL